MVNVIRLGVICVVSASILSACGQTRGSGLGNSAGSASPASSAGNSNEATRDAIAQEEAERETIWDLFNTPDANVDYQVNRYLWNASLDVLSFLPVESADPFTGLLTMGYGRAPGSGQAYKVSVRITESALDARALRVDVTTRSGPASVATRRQIEDAILTRARQLRIADAKR